MYQLLTGGAKDRDRDHGSLNPTTGHRGEGLESSHKRTTCRSNRAAVDLGHPPPPSASSDPGSQCPLPGADALKLYDLPAP